LQIGQAARVAALEDLSNERRVSMRIRHQLLEVILADWRPPVMFAVYGAVLSQFEFGAALMLRQLRPFR
jgi:hypothetical protein